MSVARREEKGFDVNVAAHLLRDVLRGQPGQQPIQAAVIISNDSDIKLPIDQARQFVPVGLINPSRNYTVGALSAQPTVGVGNHWWYQLTAADFRACQLLDPTGSVPKPAPCGGHGFGHGTRWNRCEQARRGETAWTAERR